VVRVLRAAILASLLPVFCVPAAKAETVRDGLDQPSFKWTHWNEVKLIDIKRRAQLSASNWTRTVALDALIAAYPDHLSRRGPNGLIWRDGTTMPFDDGRGAKDFATLLNAPDLEDQFYTPYRKGKGGMPPGYNEDPGRVRYEPFFRKMYGDCSKGEVSRKLAAVAWLPKSGGGTVRFTTVNGAAAQLRKVSDELESLGRSYLKYLRPTAGTYNCRMIAGTKRYSPHAYGIAIDLNVKYADYWRWAKPGADGRYPFRNRIPLEVVAVFEKHGFIWGGKWYHYDTMHFEYRPELLIAPAKKAESHP